MIAGAAKQLRLLPSERSSGRTASPILCEATPASQKNKHCPRPFGRNHTIGALRRKAAIYWSAGEYDLARRSWL
jgi:hypothetical protein